jgi:hypothetical protein
MMPALIRLKQEELEFEANLGYRARLSQKNKTKTKPKNPKSN